MKLEIKVIPGASVDRIVGWYGHRLKVSVSSPPEKGKANAAVERLLAKTLGIAKRDASIISGHYSPLKVIEINMAASEVMRLLPPQGQD